VRPSLTVPTTAGIGVADAVGEGDVVARVEVGVAVTIDVGVGVTVGELVAHWIARLFEITESSE
jgi:hypothetical protein